MSEENVEMVRRFLAALNRRDYEEASACLRADAEWHNTTAFPGARTVLGPKAITECWQELNESFDPVDYGMEVEHIVESGALVVIGVRSWGKGASSGLSGEVHWGLGVSIRDGRIQRLDVSGDYGSALEAAGLSE
jgi:ketosteroid isomerase-like protein